MNEDYRQPDYRDDVPNETVPCGPLPLASVTGSAAPVEQLITALDGLVQECEYSASSGLPFNFPDGKGQWTQLAKAKALLAALRQNGKLTDAAQ